MAAPTTWGGSLNANEIFTTIYNMIVRQDVVSKNIGNTFKSLVDLFRVEGSRYGDTYLRYSTNALRTYKYEPDTSGQLNVLAVHRPADPFVQAVVLDQFRWIPVTIDSYLTKRAFSTESVFSTFNSVCLQWLRDTKSIYESTLMNSYAGTIETSEGSQQQEVDLSGITAAATTTDEEAMNRLVAEMIAEKLADIMVAVKDPLTGKDFNDLGYYRSWDDSDFVIVWNANWVNKIRKLLEPTIFHKDGLLGIEDKYVLPGFYFGTVNTSSGTATAGTRSLIEQEIGGVHYWPGEEIASGASYLANTTYQENSDPATDGSVICKIIHKEAIPFMDGFETQTEFINAKNLSQNHYLHFGHSKPDRFYDLPLITVKANLS